MLYTPELFKSLRTIFQEPTNFKEEELALILTEFIKVRTKLLNSLYTINKSTFIWNEIFINIILVHFDNKKLKLKGLDELMCQIKTNVKVLNQAQLEEILMLLDHITGIIPYEQQFLINDVWELVCSSMDRNNTNSLYARVVAEKLYC